MVYFSIMRESTKRSNILLNGISFAHSIIRSTTNGSSTNTVDLLVEFSSGVVTELTTSGNSPLDCRWMPGSNTSNLADTSMRASLQTSNSESLDNTLSSLTSGNSDGINALGLLEDFRNFNFLLELSVSPINLSSNITSIKLDFHDMCLQLSKIELVNLSSTDDADGGTVLLHAFKVSLD